jgi:putative intracellular protease/amidase
MPGKVLFVLTSHGELGDTGRKTGFYLSELTHPLAVVREAGYDFDLASPKGGEPPMDGVKRDDPVNAAFLDDPAMMARVRETIPLDKVDPKAYVAVHFVGGHGTMWATRRWPGSRPGSTRRAASSRRCATAPRRWWT